MLIKHYAQGQKANIHFQAHRTKKRILRTFQFGSMAGNEETQKGSVTTFISLLLCPINSK